MKKLERAFYQTIEDLRTFEADVRPKLQNHLEQLDHRFLQEDLTYSKNRSLNPAGEASMPSQINDPHVLQSQLEADYAEDTLESVGTMEDYAAYKEQY